MVKYVITAINSAGVRTLAFNRDARNAYNTPEQAEQYKQQIIDNNNADTVANLIGSNLQVRPAETRISGEIIPLYFD